MSVSRRTFVSGTGLATASIFSFPTFQVSVKPAAICSGARPRRIIHLVSDGMSMGTLTCSDYLSQLNRKRSLAWINLYQNPAAYSAWVNMRSLNSIVTDSAAASSSWGCGSRVVNGALNVLPDGRKLRTLCELFGEAGWKRGLVTTTEITHATPAGFAANQECRGEADDIAVQYLDRRIEVLLGGGRKFFEAAERKDKRDLHLDFRKTGYEVVQTLPELDAAPTDKPILGTFAFSHLPYSLDHLQDPSDIRNVPTLARMTEAALERLDCHSSFLLQIEGGRVDHGCHSCDAAAAFRDQIAFDEALDVCLKFRQNSPETLIVITTDHGNGNPGLNGMGKDYGDSASLLANLVRVKKSFGAIISALEKAPSESDAAQIIADFTGFVVDPRKASMLMPYFAKEGKALYDSMNNSSVQLGQLLANYLGVGWTSSAHTADYVPLLAIGPGAERFRGFLQNTDIFRHYLSLAGIDYENPQLPLISESRHFAGDAERGVEYTSHSSDIRV